MTNNDILRRLRFAINLTDTQMRHLCALFQVEIDEDMLVAYLAKETEPQFIPCPDQVLGAFLDGLVLERRGPRDPASPPPPSNEEGLDNNMVLKKLRIALELKESDMLAILKLGGMELSPSELGALFRNEAHKNYRPAGTQVLRNFLKGLTLKMRGVGANDM